MKKVKELISQNPFWTLLIYIIFMIVVSVIRGDKTDGFLSLLSGLSVLAFLFVLPWAIIKKIKNAKSSYTANKLKKIEDKEKEKVFEDWLLQIPQKIKDNSFEGLGIDDIPLEKGEKGYWSFNADLVKERTVTTRTDYGGISGSVSVIKGVRFRSGSIQHHSERNEEVYIDDVGFLYVTNKKLLFKGDKEVIEIKFTDILQIETSEIVDNEEYIKIFKKKGKNTVFRLYGDPRTFGPIMNGLDIRIDQKLKYVNILLN